MKTWKVKSVQLKSSFLFIFMIISILGIGQGNELKKDSLKTIVNNIPSKELFFEFGIAPFFIHYKDIKQAYNFYFGAGVVTAKEKIFTISYFQYDRFQPERNGSEKDRYISGCYYFIKNKNQKVKNYLGLQLGYLYSYGSFILTPGYPYEIESYKMDFVSLGVVNQLQFKLSKNHAVNLFVSLDLGFLKQTTQRKNQVTGEILLNQRESFFDANSFKPLIVSYSYKF